LAPTTAGRTLDVSAGGEAGIDWANVGSPMTVVNLAGTQINEVNQGVDVNRLDASFTSLDNLVDFVDFGYDAATNKVNGVVLVDTATNLTNAATVGDLTAAMIASVTAAVPTSTTITNAVAAQIITDHGSGPYTQNTEPLTASQTRDALGMTSANLDSQLGTLATGANLATTDGKVDAIKAKTDQFVFTVANQVDANALSGGGSGLDAAGVRSAVGLASANLDTQFSAIPAATASAVVAKPGSDPATTPAATATWLAKLDWLYNRFAGKIVGERSTNNVNVSEQTIYNAANADIGSQSVTKTNTSITISKVE
jgi:hypothetical protein